MPEFHSDDLRGSQKDVEKKFDCKNCHEKKLFFFYLEFFFILFKFFFWVNCKVEVVAHIKVTYGRPSTSQNMYYCYLSALNFRKDFDF